MKMPEKRGAGGTAPARTVMFTQRAACPGPCHPPHLDSRQGILSRDRQRGRRWGRVPSPGSQLRRHAGHSAARRVRRAERPRVRKNLRPWRLLLEIIPRGNTPGVVTAKALSLL